MRPEAVAAGWPNGKPFYCGKTVKIPEQRLSQHRHRRTSKVGIRLQECGKFIQMNIVQIVPFDQDWIACERHWIRILRLMHPDCLNVSDGGEGPAGVVPSPVARARMSAAHMGKVNSPESIARAAASRRGMKMPPEAVAKSAAWRRGQKHSLESRAKMKASAVHRPKISPETRAKLSASLRGRVVSPETRAKLKQAWERDRESRIQKLPSRLGVTHSPETRARLSAAHTGRKLPEEQKAKIRESCRRTAALKISASASRPDI